MTDFQAKIDAIFANSHSDDERFRIAHRHEQDAVDCIIDEDFSAAQHHADIASSMYDRMAEPMPMASPNRLFLDLAWAKIQLSRAAGYRRAGDVDLAAKAFLAGENRLLKIRDAIFAAADTEHEELTFDWLSTMGALQMNRGVLQSSEGDLDGALESWRSAEEVMFDGYVKQVGPNEDVVCAGKVINLWENMMVAALEVGDVDTAVTSVSNAMKFYAYWPAHAMDHPETVVEALGAFFGALEQLAPSHRQALDAELPAPFIRMIDDILEDED